MEHTSCPKARATHSCARSFHEKEHKPVLVPTSKARHHETCLREEFLEYSVLACMLIHTAPYHPTTSPLSSPTTCTVQPRNACTYQGKMYSMPVDKRHQFTLQLMKFLYSTVACMPYYCTVEKFPHVATFTCFIRSSYYAK